MATRAIAAAAVALVALACVCSAHPFTSRFEKINVHAIRHPAGLSSRALPVAVSVNTSMIEGTRGFVEVSWSGVESPSDSDWIAVYSPAKANFSEMAPIKYKFAKASKTHLTTGAGSLVFDIANMRDDYVFAFYRNGTDSPVIAGLSSAVAFSNYNAPTQVRIALGVAEGSLTLVVAVSGIVQTCSIRPRAHTIASQFPRIERETLVRVTGSRGPRATRALRWQSGERRPACTRTRPQPRRLRTARAKCAAALRRRSGGEIPASCIRPRWRICSRPYVITTLLATTPSAILRSARLWRRLCPRPTKRRTLSRTETWGRRKTTGAPRGTGTRRASTRRIA
eukprot:Opistho-1_new@99065